MIMHYTNAKKPARTHTQSAPSHASAPLSIFSTSSIRLSSVELSSTTSLSSLLSKFCRISPYAISPSGGCCLSPNLLSNFIVSATLSLFPSSGPTLLPSRSSSCS